MNSIYCKSKKIFITFLVLLIFSTPILQTFATTSNVSNSTQEDSILSNSNVSTLSSRRSTILTRLVDKIKSSNDNSTENTTVLRRLIDIIKSRNNDDSQKTSILNSLLNRLMSRDDNTSNITNVSIPNSVGPGYNAHYRLLNTKKQKIYRYLYSKKSNFIEGKTIDLSGLRKTLGSLTSDEVFEVVRMLYQDQPEFYYIVMDNSTYITGDSTPTSGTLKLCFNKKNYSLKSELNAIDKIANSVVNKANTYSNDYQKIKYVHDYICNNMVYKLNIAYSIDGFITKKGQCCTYANMFLYIMNKLNINCIYTIGSKGNVNHAWNRVQLNGKWYVLDTCLDDYSSNCQYDYFLKGKSAEEYYNSDNSKYPALSNSDYK